MKYKKTGFSLGNCYSRFFFPPSRPLPRCPPRHQRHAASLQQLQACAHAARRIDIELIDGEKSGRARAPV